MDGNEASDPVPLLRSLIAEPSCDPPGGELAVARIVHAALRDRGISASLDEFEPGRANVIGRLPGEGLRPPLVLSAHLDTMPPGNGPWSFDPFAGDLVDGRVRGRGAADMKSTLAAFVAAAARLAATRRPPAGDVILAFTAGESANGLGARRLVAQGFQAEIGAFLCGEPSSLDIIVAEKAALWLAVTAHGRAGHVSGDPGINAIDLMLGFLADLREFDLQAPAHPLLSGPSLSVGRIEGGDAVNLTPDLCRAELDLRFGPGVDPGEVVGRIAARAPEGVEVASSDFKPAVETDPDSTFVRRCAAAVATETGRTPAIRGVSYYSDAAILLDGLNVPFAILGPGDLGMSGQPDESVAVDAVRQATAIYTTIIRDWRG